MILLPQPPAPWLIGAGVAVGAYLLGCLTAGYYVVRLRTGVDIRATGSGTVGARNAGRVSGKTAFVLTLLLDFGKGALAVWAARRLAADELVAVAMVAVVVGHIWPVQLGFRGGKGVATSLGALAVYDFRLATVVLVVFIVAVPIVRRTTLAGMVAFAGLPLAAVWRGLDPVAVLLVSTVAVMVLVAHRRDLVEQLPRLGRRLHHPKPDHPLA